MNRKKKKNPIGVIVSILVILALFVFGYFWFSGRFTVPLIGFVRDLPVLGIFRKIPILAGLFFALGAAVLILVITLIRKGRERTKQLRETRSVVEGLSNDFSLMLYVNIKTGEDRVIRAEEDFLRYFPAWDRVHNLGDRLTMISNAAVHPRDRKTFLEETSHDRIINGLEKTGTYFVKYRILVHGIMQHWQAKFTYADKKKKHMLVGVHNVEAEFDIQEHRRVVMNDLTRDFDFVVYVQLHESGGQDGTHLFRFSKTLEKAFPEWNPDMSFHSILDQLSELITVEAERNTFIRQTRRNVVLERISSGNSYYVNFKALVDGREQYYQMKFSPDRKDGGPVEGFVAGVQNVDSEMKAELEKRREIEQTVAQRTAELRDKNLALNRMNEGIIDLLGKVVESRDLESGEHIQRVKGYTSILARQIMEDYPEYGLDERMVLLIASASALHDVGKIRIPDAILCKPGRFTDEEFAIMKTHTIKGCEVLAGLTKYWDEEYLNISMDICRYHHEKWDGRGYPDGLKGDDIPIAAQIVSIADIFDALTNERVYKSAFEPEKAFRMIENGECGAFSEKILAALKKCQQAFIIQSMAVEAVMTDSDIDRMLAVEAFQDRGTAEILRSLSVDYEAVFLVDVDTDIIRDIRITDAYNKSYKRLPDEPSYARRVADGIQYNVVPEDRQYVTEAFDAEVVFARLREDKKYICTYRVMEADGEIRYKRAHFALAGREAGRFFILGIRDYNAEMVSELSSQKYFAGKLGTVSMSMDILNKANIGLWAFELDDGKEPRMYVDETMAALLGISKQISPEETYRAWYDNVDDAYYGEVTEAVGKMTSGEHAEVQYPWHHPDGSLRYVRCGGVLNSTYQDGIRIEGTHQDITELIHVQTEELDRQKERVQILEEQNSMDALTGAMSRQAYLEEQKRLNGLINNGECGDFAVLFCDMNDLKRTNDEKGHEIGDMLLKESVQTILDVFKNSTVYRIGGDEFVSILQGEEYANRAQLLKELKKISKKNITDGGPVIACGMSEYMPGKDSFEFVAERADAEMYRHKEQLKKAMK